MAKAKQTRRMIAMALAAAVTVTAVPVDAMAASDYSKKAERAQQKSDNLAKKRIPTVTVTINAEGTADAETGELGENGSIETKTETVVKDGYGNVVETTTVVEGEETTTTVTPDDGNGAQTPVTAPIVPGGTGEGTASETTTDGDLPDGEGGEYDYTETTETDRTVTTETSDVKVTVNDSDTGLVGDQETDMKGLAPVYDEYDDPDMNFTAANCGGDGVGKGGMFDYQFNDGLESKYAKDPENWDMPEGADVRYVGTGEHSKYYVATAYVEYEKNEDGSTVYDENGNPVIKEIRRYSDENSPVITVDGQPITELPDGINLVPEYDNYGGSRPFIFALMDQDGNAYYAYCCDLETDTASGWWYSVSNLEDSDYYASEDSAEHIRSIIMNGYWGTSDVPNEDGSHNTGSLEKIKADMKAAIANGDMEDETVNLPDLDADGNTVVDETGAPVMKDWKISELIDRLTEGEALLATQAAVWTYANGSNDVQNGKDGSIVVDPDGYKWNQDPNVGSKKGEAMDDYGSAVVDFMYKWLVGLETEDESTVVINEKNFVEDMNLVVGDKVAEHMNNQDDNKDNDVYNTALNFTLAFEPDPENDDLLVHVKYKDLDGNEQTVVKRLAGENTEDQDYEGISPEEDGSYIISGLKLSENEDFNFDLRLEGTQYLEQGAYVYAPVNGRDVSQTFVGIAEGERNVDVSMGVTVSFDVDEDNKLTATRKWRSESHHRPEGGGVDPDPEDPNPTPDPKDPNPTPDPGENIPDEDVPLTDLPEVPEAGAEEPVVEIGEEDVPLADMEIADEEVPLAAVPETGDSNHVAGFGAMALAALAGMFGLRRKENN